MANKCCFSCGFASLLDSSRDLEHQGRKEQASSQRKGEDIENAGLYVCKVASIAYLSAAQDFE